MTEKIIVACISSVGVIITVVIALIGYIWTKQHNKEVIFNQTVSERRNIWLNEMREYISEMLAQADKSQTNYKPLEYYKARHQVVLRLNLKETLHLMLLHQIKILDNCTTKSYPTARDNIIEISQAILKEEWEKVKLEAKGKGDK